MELNSAIKGEVVEKEKEQKEEKGQSKIVLILLIVCIVVILILLGVVFYFIFRGDSQKDKESTQTQEEESKEEETKSEEEDKRVGWQSYSNSRYGFKVEVPSTLDKEESANDDGATFTTWDPPMTVRTWGELNTSDLTAQEAIDFDKNDYAVNEVEGLEVVEEGKVTLGGEEGVKSVWSYSSYATGDSNTSARAYVIKGDNIYKIEFLIDTLAWSEYSSMFDEILDSFNFN